MTQAWGWRVTGVVVAAIALLAMRATSLAPLRTASAGESVLRVSWSARPERIEHCRRLSDAELAERPQHMRLRWECEGRFARYLLDVSVDGRRIAADTVRGDGLRHDRPIHIFREYALVPGQRHVTVALRRIDASVRPDSASDQTAAGSAAADRETREAQERRVRRAEALPETLALDSIITVRSGRVVLVSYDTDRRAFALRTGQ